MHIAASQFLQSLPSTVSATNNSMKTLINPISVSSINPRNLLTLQFSMFSSIPIKTTFNRASSTSRILVVKCNSGEKANEGLKDLLAGVVDKQVEELLNRKENKALLDGLEKATLRVEIAKKELAEIEKQEIEAAQLRNYVNQLETRTSEIAECQREISEARTLVEEAESSLSLNMGASSMDALKEKQNEKIDKDEERWESIKAATVSAIVGTLVGLPISFAQVTSSVQLILPLAITFISCALFGLTFRYTIRKDLDNIQLKTGTSAAFGIIKGLAALGAGPPLELDVGSFSSHALDGALYVSENLFIFIFASVALDYCFKMRLLSPFPIQRSDSQTIRR